ncbi:hypothetical protein [Glaciibacter psychrotolerans]|uniref:Uncharacterized protein n=1 Tax=Glaciibacter psychrotolerans TaxID=670054 RepID=A0A7Z0EDZ2_9MICO|nr:hypothetical protein [Leifsonia psychrotolerans]NYJ19184.1 hypothetical protein [Leifsonia psychrotolerans]
MADERIRLTQRVNGGLFLRVEAATALREGKDWLESEILKRGLYPVDLGEPKENGRWLDVPVRKDE